MPIGCTNEDCGMTSAYRMWRDGSYQKVFEACWHTKTFPTREQIEKAVKKESK